MLSESNISISNEKDITDKEIKDVNPKKETFSKIEFDKHILFIRSLPNTIGFDKVSITNTGTTCVYFKWQKKKLNYELQFKKSEGIDRFFCHYTDSKIFPGETKEFVFSFFSEKNGLFCEDWTLATKPPLDCNLDIHINGMVHLYKDIYSAKIEDLNKDLLKKGINTAINEFVIDIVDNVKASDPPLPDMTDKKTFKFYFELRNKDYNIFYSESIMKKLLDLYAQIDKEQKFWNGSIDDLKSIINALENEQDKVDYNNKLNIILHDARHKHPEDSCAYAHIKNFFIEQLNNFNDIVNEVREEYLMPPKICDWLTKETLNEQELTKYKTDLKKKDDEYIKKAKKKPFKNQEEEQQELNEYNTKLISKISNMILEKCSEIDQNKLTLNIKSKALNSYIFNEDYIERLTRVKTLRHIKNEGGFDNKYVMLRIDIESYKKIYEDKYDEEGKVVGQTFKSIDYLDTKDKMLDTLNYLLKNGVKAVLLLVDFGPKLGKEEKEYSLVDLREYIENNLDNNPTYFANNINELIDYEQKLKEEELKDNCCIIMENINFNMEETGLDIIDDDIVNPTKKVDNITLFRKQQFINKFTKDKTIYINDSILSFDKYYPTIIDQNIKLKVIGEKIDKQLKKITDFFSIQSKDYLLIVGDNEVYKTTGRSISDSPKEGYTYSLDDAELETMITNLLIVNAIMIRFKEIFFFGKIALQFLQFLRKDYTLFDNQKYQVQTQLFQLMKYILVKSNLYGIKITLPEDFKILEKEEYQKHLDRSMDENGVVKNYTKEVKVLLKREILQDTFEAPFKDKEDKEELEENMDYNRVKLEPEQKDNLKKYKLKSVSIRRQPFCYNIVKEFIKAQNVDKPKKIFKTPMDVYLFNEAIYDKDIVYPEEIISSSELHQQNELKRIQALNEELNQDNNVEDNKESEGKNVEEEKKEDNNNNNTNTNENNTNTNENKENKDNNINNSNNSNKSNNSNNNSMNNNENKEIHPEKPKTKKKYDPRIFNYDKYELVDYGEKSYKKLIDSINTMIGVMWLGKLSPNKVENVFDNYQSILECIYQRKKQLKEKFEIEQATQAKKLNETELKAKKQLLNVLLKSNTVYEIIKDNFKNVLNNNPNPTVDELMNEDEEEAQDDEQYNHELNLLIDYNINDDYQLINNILMGNHISGFYGLSAEQPVVKEEEFDPKILEEIINN